MVVFLGLLLGVYCDRMRQKSLESSRSMSSADVLNSSEKTDRDLLTQKNHHLHELEVLIYELSFDLLSENEQHKLLNCVWNLHQDIAVYSDNSVEDEKKHFLDELKMRLKQMQKQIPSDVWDVFVETQKYTAEHLQEWTSEQTVKEVVRMGIEQLQKTFEQIKQKTGKLPRVVIYPDTSGRPLHYAIVPLLHKLYRSHGEQAPVEEFFKSYTSLILDENRKSVLEKWEKKQDKLQEKLERVQQLFKQVTHELNLAEFEPEDDQAQKDLLQIEQILHQTENDLAQYTKNVEKQKKGGANEIMKKRMEEVLKHAGDAPLLVIDDVVAASGRTLQLFYRLAQDTAITDRTYFFAFIGDPATFKKVVPTIPIDQFSLGVGLSQTEEIPTDWQDRTTLLFSKTEKTDDKVREEIKDFFFPYRSRKIQITGVIKDTFSLDPYVERSVIGDQKLMREVRQKYYGWGKQIVEELLKKRKRDFKRKN